MLLLLVFAVAQGAFFTTSVGTGFYDLTNATNRGVVETPTGDAIVLGFLFPYFGPDVIRLRISPYGFLYFGDKPACTAPPCAQQTDYIAPYMSAAVVGSDVLYQHRVTENQFVVQWATGDNQGTRAPTLSFGAVLCANGTIAFFYGAAGTLPTTDDGSFTIGVSSPTYGATKVSGSTPFVPSFNGQLVVFTPVESCAYRAKCDECIRTFPRAGFAPPANACGWCSDSDVCLEAGTAAPLGACSREAYTSTTCPLSSTDSNAVALSMAMAVFSVLLGTSLLYGQDYGGRKRAQRSAVVAPAPTAVNDEDARPGG